MSSEVCTNLVRVQRRDDADAVSSVTNEADSIRAALLMALTAPLVTVHERRASWFHQERLTLMTLMTLCCVCSHGGVS